MPNQIRDLARNRRRILLYRELRENVFQRWHRHQRAQPLDRVVSHNSPSMQNHYVRTDPFHRLQFVRAEQHYLASRRQFLYQAAQHQPRAHIEPRKKGSSSSTFCRMPFE
jgi:hypothetical protein